MEQAGLVVELIIPGHTFGVDDPQRAEELTRLGVGGFCLYGGRPEEVADFTAGLQRHAPRPLLFCADYEDGLPTQCSGGTALPSNMGLGAAGSETLAFEKGVIAGAEARALGVSWVLGPVCDLATAPANPIVNVRAFSGDPGAVARLARAYLRGLHSAGALGCLKHFPGHGETLEDSHLGLPTVRLSREQFKRREMAPFAALANSADAVMTAHLLAPSLSGPELPYSLSSDVAKTLRGELGFGGLVVTDSLAMRAVAEGFEELEAAKRALSGGSDILLVPKDPRRLARELEAAVAGDPALAAAVAAAHARLAKARAACRKAPAVPSLSSVGGPEHVERAERLAEACLSWARQPAPPLPSDFSYWEPDASGPQEWLGEPFLEGLRASGRRPRPWEEGSSVETLVIGSFLNPRAYAGRIGYDSRQRARLAAALKSARSATLVSFGSPFVFGDVRARGLCAFSQNEPAQRAAARALAGLISPKGRMPVAF
ncbi:MAG: hypothetical protein KGO96_01320 [Elusimicrobia bacterium]|nr:hypothetical protein [Elusimicrobiota bacterium]MDE2237418.1 hypothetical protein [Elusimicrobiota bacterium]MDE2424535.1 hypothetical protein [Elusimicrobiota bacterium]